MLLGYFGERDHAACGNCDNCLKPARVWDGLVAAQKALSAVVRTGQRFGVAYLVDVLLGRANERMQRFGHDQLKTFGVGTELGKREWHSVFRQLVAQGHLAVDVEGHGGLHLGDSARRRAARRGAGRVPRRGARSRRARKRARAPPRPTAPTTPDDEALWQRLRALRLELAREQGVPPYVIFHDATLARDGAPTGRAISTRCRAIPGVGASKLKRYGERFLAVLGAA